MSDRLANVDDIHINMPLTNPRGFSRRQNDNIPRQIGAITSAF